MSSSKLGLKLEPLGLSRTVAASYIGLSPTKFDELVKDGRMPCARIVDGRRIWGRLELEEAFNALPHATNKPGPVDPWLDQFVT